MFSNIAPKLSASEIEAVVSRVTSRFPGTEITYFLLRDGVTWEFTVSLRTVPIGWTTPKKTMVWTVGCFDLEASLVRCVGTIQYWLEKALERWSYLEQELGHEKGV